MTRECFLITVLWFLISCAPYPSVPYDLMDEAVLNAETEEEAEFYRKEIQRFEDDAEDAEAYFLDMDRCRSASSRYIWQCRTSYDDRRIEKQMHDLDSRVKLYRKMRTECGCVSRQDFLRDLM